MFHASKVDIAWAAGFYEGEGSISLCRCKEKTTSVQLNIRQQNREPLDDFLGIFGVGNICGPYMALRAKRGIYSYTAYGIGKCQFIVALMWPWLSFERQAQASVILDALCRGRKWGRYATL